MKTSPYYKVLIADDEPEAIDLIAALLQPYKEFKVLHVTQDSKMAGQIVSSGSIDLAFLDVEFPGATAFDSLENIPAKTNLVFVSAHERYAIKAIRHSATDYLLKPVDPDDFDNVMSRVIESKKDAAQESKLNWDELVTIRELQNCKIAVPTQHGYQYYQPKDIAFLTAKGSYTELHETSGKSFIISRNLSDFDRILSSKGFIRIHRSHLINCECIHSISRLDGGIVEMNDGSTLSISRKYKEATLKRISELSEKI